MAWGHELHPLTCSAGGREACSAPPIAMSRYQYGYVAVDRSGQSVRERRKPLCEKHARQFAERFSLELPSIESAA